ncbi:MAG: glutamate--tRNA ligase, partial [Campylobacterales bacterium]
LTPLLQLDPKLEGLAQLYREEVSTLKELKEKLLQIYRPVEEWHGFEEEGCRLKEAILGMPELPEEYNLFKQGLIEKTGLKGKRLFMPLRILLIGEPHGPEIRDLYRVMRPFLKELLRHYR